MRPTVLITLVTALVATMVGAAPPAHAASVALTGRVVDQVTGAGIDGARIDVFDGAGAFASDTTEGGGYYTVTVAAGSLKRTVRLRGFYPVYDDTVTVATDATTSTPLPEITMAPSPTAVVSGTVVAASGGGPLAGALVTLDGAAFVETSAASGSFSAKVPLGSTLVTASAPGRQPQSVRIDVTASTTLPAFALVLQPDGLQVRARTSFGGPARGVPVRLTPTSGPTAPTTVTADADGLAFFPGLVAGTSYQITTSVGGTFNGSTPVDLTYAGGFTTADVTVGVDDGCTPASAATSGASDLGFENGLTSWTRGFVADSADVITGDSFVPTPRSGQRMLRISRTADSADASPVPGPTILCQDFVATRATETLWFKVFTYDTFASEGITITLTDVTQPSAPTTVAIYPGTVRSAAAGSLFSTDWIEQRIDLGNRLGRRIRLRIEARNDFFDPTWVYVDAAPPAPVVPPAPPAAAPVTSTTSLKLPRTAKRNRTSKVIVRVAAGVPATGPVVVRYRSKVVGRGTVVNGVATVRVARFKKAGRYALKATFGGSGTVLPSVSRSATLRVR